MYQYVAQIELLMLLKQLSPFLIARHFPDELQLIPYKQKYKIHADNFK